MFALLPTVFLASLIGSLHCAGMCGGFVIALNQLAQQKEKKVPLPLIHALYHLGRLTTYITLGTLAGILGDSFNRFGKEFNVTYLAALTSATILIIYGGQKLFSLPLWKSKGERQTSTKRQSIIKFPWQKVRGFVQSLPPQIRAAGFGLLTTFLPCGWLYAFIVIAGGTGHALTGMLVMSSFWLGTLPPLLVLGFGIARVEPRVVRLIPAVTSIIFVLIGLATIAYRTQIDFPRVAIGKEQVAQSVAKEPPCHHHTK